MNRRTLLYGLGAGILAAPLVAEAQQAGKIPRVGMLNSSPPDKAVHFVDAFRQGLRELGYLESQNIIIEYKYAHGVMERLPALAADLVRLKVNVIVAPTNQVIAATRQATSTIPIVSVTAIDPVGQGFIASFARPGGNITGMAWDQDIEITGKYLEFLREVVPNLSRVAGLIDPGQPGIEAYRKSGDAAARRMSLLFSHVEIRDAVELDKAFDAIVGQHAQAVIVYGSAMITPHMGRIVELAAKHRLPIISIYREAVVLGGLMSYGVSLPDSYRRAARYVVEILRGANPAVLPMEQPTKYELVINLKTAKALGLTIPPSLLLRADQVIE